jgi:hypothetical protein
MRGAGSLVRGIGVARVSIVILAAALVALAFDPAAAAPKRTKGGDAVWTHPDFAALDVERIAFLPVATYDNNLQSAKLVENAFGAALRTTQYRWVSPTTARDRLRAAGGDSALKALNAGVAKHARVDSLEARRLCELMRSDAVLSVRVDLWDKIEMEWNQPGKPSTTVQLKAALVDSAGRLLWTAAGSETAEGAYHDPGSGTVGVKSSGLSTTPMTGQAGAPAFEDVLTRLFARWAPLFPARPVTAVPASPAN